jgi:two-component system sensor histidine kinase/response regulator
MARILVVDDEPLNRQLLRACFGGSGHEIVEARDGHEALIAAEEHTPDLVLLDVMMPGMSGYECVAQLRAMFEGALVPIVLVTALHDREARVTGLAAGADEFLTKPIDREELLVRAGNLLALRAREVALQERNIELVELQRFQDDTMAMLVHDLKSPLSVIQASVDYLIGRGEADADTVEALEDCRQASGRIARLVGNILEVAHAESGRLAVKPAPTALAPIVEAVLRPRRAALERRKIGVEAAADVTAEVDRDLIARVVENLIDSAGRHTPQGGRIRVWAQAVDGAVELRVGSSGPAIPEVSRALVFEKYTQVWDARGGGAIGLGMYFCRLTIEAHGGSVWIEEAARLPAVFALRVPHPAAPRPLAPGVE